MVYPGVSLPLGNPYHGTVFLSRRYTGANYRLACGEVLEQLERANGQRLVGDAVWDQANIAGGDGVGHVFDWQHTQKVDVGLGFQRGKLFFTAAGIFTAGEDELPVGPRQRDFAQQR